MCKNMTYRNVLDSIFRLSERLAHTRYCAFLRYKPSPHVVNWNRTATLVVMLGCLIWGIILPKFRKGRRVRGPDRSPVPHVHDSGNSRYHFEEYNGTGRSVHSRQHISSLQSMTAQQQNFFSPDHDNNTISDVVHLWTATAILTDPELKEKFDVVSGDLQECTVEVPFMRVSSAWRLVPRYVVDHLFLTYAYKRSIITTFQTMILCINPV